MSRRLALNVQQGWRRKAHRGRLTTGRQPEIDMAEGRWRSSWQTAKTKNHTGRSYGALIPLLGEINPKLLLFLHIMPFFIHLQ